MANVPMIPNTQDISEMKRLRDIMSGNSPTVRDDVLRGNYSGGGNGAPRQNNAGRRPITESYNTMPIGGVAGREDVDAMRQVLERFKQAAGDTVEKLVEEASYNPEVREALQTRSTSTGAIIGKWEVKVSLEETAKGKTRKLYSVINPSTKKVVAENLVILEAAHAMVKYLNKGLPFENNKIQEVVELEETFNRNRIDAARFKQRYERCMQLKETEAGDVFASRYQRARALALAAQDQICSILESIR
jgi:hypothetical protein